MKTQYDVLMQDPEFRKQVSAETLVAEASELIAKLMAKENMSKADLARRLNRSRAWVTQLLSGRANMTIRTLAEVSFALGAEVKLSGQSPPDSSFAGPTLRQAEGVEYRETGQWGRSPVWIEGEREAMDSERPLDPQRSDPVAPTEYAA